MVAEGFFAFYMIVQVVIVVVLTPAYVAGAVAEEKDRKTLEFLMATDLDNREIVFSKLLSRLANMTLLLLTGLPILSILQLMGGVDPELMLAGFAGVALTMLGIASISILFSTLLKKPRDAISVTYLFLLAYGSIATTALVIPGGWMLTPIWFGENPPTVRDAVLVANAGNPITAIGDVIRAIGGGNRGARTNLAAELPGILTRYTWFHLALSAFCITWSILRVRHDRAEADLSRHDNDHALVGASASARRQLPDAVEGILHRGTHQGQLAGLDRRSGHCRSHARHRTLDRW